MRFAFIRPGNGTPFQRPSADQVFRNGEAACIALRLYDFAGNIGILFFGFHDGHGNQAAK